MSTTGKWAVVVLLKVDCGSSPALHHRPRSARREIAWLRHDPLGIAFYRVQMKPYSVPYIGAITHDTIIGIMIALHRDLEVEHTPIALCVLG